jgi:hypothetical protein
MIVCRMIDKRSGKVFDTRSTLRVHALVNILLRLTRSARYEFELTGSAVPARCAESQFGIAGIGVRCDGEVRGGKRAKVWEQLLAGDSSRD